MRPSQEIASSRSGRATSYRADIDGLRAIAVVLVLFDHLHLRHFGGGYVGVDVFFVISGYLIGASLISEFRRQAFSLSAFYERRCRRILPALLVLIAVVGVLAYCYLIPSAFMAYQYSAIAALLSFSNLLFWRQAGYFDSPSASKPLLHTWSLAVEEQFYLFFPLLLLAVFRWFPSRLRTILWVATAVSFAVSVWMVKVDSPTAFFWAPLRAWELLLGCMLSQYTFSALRRSNLRQGVAFVGFALIAVPALLYTSRTSFPGLGALLPCCGAAIIIAAGQAGPSLVGSLLSTSPFNFIGRISYSLYLWHWPLIVFQQTNMMISTRPLWTKGVKLEVAGLSLLAATLSWRFVETPFRTGRFRPARKTLFALAGGTMAVLIAISASLIVARGVPGRFPQEARRIAAFSEYDSAQDWRRGTCFLSDKDTFASFQPALCLNGTARQKQILLYGDSTAADLYPGMSQVFPAMHFQQATSASCPPVPDASGVGPQYASNCRAMAHYINGTYVAGQHPDAILLAASWAESDLPGLAAEIRFLQENRQQVIVIGPELEFDFDLPALLSVELLRNDSEKLRSERITQHLLPEGAILDRRMKALAETTWHVQYISIFDTLCHQQFETAEKSEWRTTQGCPLLTDSGAPILFDGHHFTRSASILFAETLRDRSQLP